MQAFVVDVGADPALHLLASNQSPLTGAFHWLPPLGQTASAACAGVVARPKPARTSATKTSDHIRRISASPVPAEGAAVRMSWVPESTAFDSGFAAFTEQWRDRAIRGT